MKIQAKVCNSSREGFFLDLSHYTSDESLEKADDIFGLGQLQSTFTGPSARQQLLFGTFQLKGRTLFINMVQCKELVRFFCQCKHSEYFLIREAVLEYYI